MPSFIWFWGMRWPRLTQEELKHQESSAPSGICHPQKGGHCGLSLISDHLTSKTTSVSRAFLLSGNAVTRTRGVLLGGQLLKGITAVRPRLGQRLRLPRASLLHTDGYRPPSRESRGWKKQTKLVTEVFILVDEEGMMSGTSPFLYKLWTPDELWLLVSQK